jgi:hypothetical protein
VELNVEVAVEKFIPLVVPMERMEPGDVVAMPTLPLARTVMNVDVDVPPVVEAIVKSGVLAAVVTELEMERIEDGEVVPIPTFPDTMSPFAGAALTPAYEPMETPPATSSLDTGETWLGRLMPTPPEYMTTIGAVREPPYG